MDNLPLLELFTQLRKAGLPLGIDDYQAVLNALQAGYGIENKAALARLCRTLWIKSKQDKQVFDYHFENIISSKTESIKPSTLITCPASISDKSQKENVPAAENKSFQILTYLKLLQYYVIPVGIYILVFGITSRIWNSNRVPIFISMPVKQVVQGTFYKYKIEARDIDKKDTITIEALRYPCWLTFDSNKNGTATLYGTEGNTTGICKDKTDASLSGNLPKKKPKSYVELQVRDKQNATSIQKFQTKVVKLKNYSYDVELQVRDKQNATSIQKFQIKIVDKNQPPSSEISIWFLLLILFFIFAVAYVISKKKVENSGDSAVKNQLNSEPENTTSDNNKSQTLGNANNETKVLETRQETFQAETVKPLNRFIQITEYPPITCRQMKQSWRYLRRMLREGVPIELDIEETIERISKQGVLLEPVIVPRRINRSKLLLLIDRDGSMIPFQNLSHQLAETAIRGGRLEGTDIFYFHNCPTDYLYRDRHYQMPEKIDDILNNLRFPHTSALIFSDAGAARGGLNPERVAVTTQFLEQLRQQVPHIAWLNPMPRYRWFGTTAHQIARLVPMFELSRQGFHNAISMLRGQSGHFETSKL
jgi:uncharacterized protein with von Willebrand factor type A (vWA) domain